MNNTHIVGVLLAKRIMVRLAYNQVFLFIYNMLIILACMGGWFDPAYGSCKCPDE